MNKHLIYLAAGNSRRFGTNKLLHSFQGRPLYRYGLEMLSDFCRSRDDCSLLVVSQYEEILKEAEQSGAAYVYSPRSADGMSWTLKTALHALGEIPEEDFLIFVVADQPWLSERTVARMADCAAPGIETACVAFQGRRGNPTMFSAKLIPELLALREDEGGRKVLRAHDCLLVEVDEEQELMDIDTPDYK